MSVIEREILAASLYAQVHGRTISLLPWHDTTEKERNTYRRHAKTLFKEARKLSSRDV